MKKAFSIGLSLVAAPVWAVGVSEVEVRPTRWHLGANTHLLFSNANVEGHPQGGTRTLLNETNVRAEYDRASLGILFTDRIAPDPERRAGTDRPLVLEKVTAAFESEQFSVKLGDSYQELGRGIALSLFREAVFGLDTTLQGAAVRYSPRLVDINAFVGRVRTLQVPVAINPQPNPLPTSDLFLAGGSAKITVAPDTKVEAHYLVAKNQPFNRTRFDQGWNTTGASVQVDGIADRIDLYAEANVLHSTAYGTSDIEKPTGYGSYVSLTYSAQPWKVRLEGKDYRQFAFGLNRPPTLEDNVVPTLNNETVSATRVVAERRLGDNPNNLVNASFLYGWDGIYTTQVNHGIIGGKFVGPWDVIYEWKGGFRDMPGSSWLAHGLFKGKLKTYKGQALEIGWRKWYQRYNISLSPIDDDHNALDMSYVFSERYSAAFTYEWVPTVFDDENPNFLSAGGTAKFGPLAARVFVGRTSGGFICSGGVCRQVPPYTGAYLDATYTF